MNLSDDELRTLVRDVIARVRKPEEPRPDQPLRPGGAAHPSHIRLTLPAAGDGECVIEPVVRCSHCGFCQSFGH